MRLMSRMIALSLGVALAGSTTCGFAKKSKVAPTGEVMSTFSVLSPIFADLEGGISYGVVLRDKFEENQVSVNLDLMQDYRGKLVGTATLSGSDGTSIQTNVTGKLKAQPTLVTFTLKGKAKTEDGQKSSISIKGVLTSASSPDVDQATSIDDLKTTSIYEITTKASGNKVHYNFLADAAVYALDYISFRPADPLEFQGHKGKKGYSFYILNTPWGSAVASGALLPAAGGYDFTAKAPKFQFTGNDRDGDALHLPETVSGKIGFGKFQNYAIITDLGVSREFEN